MRIRNIEEEKLLAKVMTDEEIKENFCFGIEHLENHYREMLEIREYNAESYFGGYAHLTRVLKLMESELNKGKVGRKCNLTRCHLIIEEGQEYCCNSHKRFEEEGL